MRTVNKVILVGQTANEPQEQPDGSWAVSLATRSALGTRTDWHRVVFPARVWTGCDRLPVRSRVFVEAHIVYSSYQRDGMSIPAADIVVDEFIVLSDQGARQVAGVDS